MAAISETETTEPAPRRTMLWLEVAVILLLTWLPAIISGVDNRYRGPVTFTYEIYEMAGSLGRIAVVLFIVLTADGHLDQLGITKSKWTVDLPLAVALAAGLYFIDQAYRLLPRSVVAGLVGHSSLAYRSLLYNLPLWLVFLSLVMAVVFEEVVFRAYLITRLRSCWQILGWLSSFRLHFSGPVTYIRAFLACRSPSSAVLPLGSSLSKRRGFGQAF